MYWHATRSHSCQRCACLSHFSRARALRLLVNLHTMSAYAPCQHTYVVSLHALCGQQRGLNTWVLSAAG